MKFREYINETTKSELAKMKSDRQGREQEIIRKGKEIGVGTLNPHEGKKFIEYKGEAWETSRAGLINRGPVKKFKNDVKKGNFKFVKLSE